MPTIVVEVMPKAELLDPQGKALAAALARSGAGSFTDVRVGKRFEITTDRLADDALLAEIRTIADDILSNSVIEDVVSITVAEPEASGEPVASGSAARESVGSNASGTDASGPDASGATASGTSA